MPHNSTLLPLPSPVLSTLVYGYSDVTSAPSSSPSISLPTLLFHPWFCHSVIPLIIHACHFSLGTSLLPQAVTTAISLPPAPASSFPAMTFFSFSDSASTYSRWLPLLLLISPLFFKDPAFLVRCCPLIGSGAPLLAQLFLFPTELQEVSGLWLSPTGPWAPGHNSILYLVNFYSPFLQGAQGVNDKLTDTQKIQGKSGIELGPLRF